MPWKAGVIGGKEKLQINTCLAALCWLFFIISFNPVSELEKKDTEKSVSNI